MTTVTLTLAEFLLARISDEAEGASAHHRLLCLRTACDAEGCLWGADEEELMEQERVCTCGYPARVLAECEAKRRIVGLGATRTFSRGEAGLVMDIVLRDLAAVYAHHADYRAEWRA